MKLTIDTTYVVDPFIYIPFASVLQLMLAIEIRPSSTSTQISTSSCRVTLGLNSAHKTYLPGLADEETEKRKYCFVSRLGSGCDQTDVLQQDLSP